jgi:hypothetical protein
MTFTQYRLEKRNGEIVKQKRTIITETRGITPWWKFWEYEYVIDTEYGEWEDMPWINV